MSSITSKFFARMLINTFGHLSYRFDPVFLPSSLQCWSDRRRHCGRSGRLHLAADLPLLPDKEEEREWGRHGQWNQVSAGHRRSFTAQYWGCVGGGLSSSFKPVESARSRRLAAGLSRSLLNNWPMANCKTCKNKDLCYMSGYCLLCWPWSAFQHAFRAGSHMTIIVRVWQERSSEKLIGVLWQCQCPQWPLHSGFKCSRNYID